MLLLPCAQDRLLGLQGAHEIAAGIAHAHCSHIDSPLGHLAWRAQPGSPQTRFVTREVRAFLGLPHEGVGPAPVRESPAAGEG